MSRRNAVVYFNPHSPYGERQYNSRRTGGGGAFQSTLSIRGATWLFRLCLLSGYFIPHSPYGERLYLIAIGDGHGAISIHTPHTGSDCKTAGIFTSGSISIHTPLTGSDKGYRNSFLCHGISIHTPHTGSDRPLCVLPVPPVVFQSTLPLRGATLLVFQCMR